MNTFKLKIGSPFLTLILFFMVSFSLIPTVYAKGETLAFPDVPESHWAYETVMTAVKRGYVDGKPDGTFAPDQEVSRSEFIKMVVAALEMPVEKQQKGEEWYEPYTSAALESGLIVQDEYANGSFTSYMNRMEMVRVAVKAVEEQLRNDDVTNEELMLSAVKQGLILGIDGKLVQEGLSSRAQAVTVIERILALRDGDTLPTDEEAIAMAEVEWKISIGDIWEEKSGVIINTLEVGRYFEMRVHDSFRVEDGHLKGYLPELPEGLQYALTFRAYYEPNSNVVARDVEYLSYGQDLKPGDHFSLPIPHEEKVQEMILHVGIRVTENGSKRRFSIMDYYNNREITETIKY